MSNIRVLQDITVYNSITAVSGIAASTLSIGGAGLSGNNLAVNGNAVIVGNLTVTGSANFTNTEFTTTSAISVVNTGTGPALVANQTGDQAIAAFYDDGNIALYIDGHTATPGYVGIGTSAPNKTLTVVGDISATGTIYGPNTLNKFVSSFGNGVDKIYTMSHTLNVADVVVSVIDSNTKEVVYPAVTQSAYNQVTFEFSVAPALTAYKAIIVG